jgi:uncharacterized protein
MLFTSRTQPTWRARLRVAVWPRRTWARSARYLGWRLLRLGGSPHGLALGVGTGVFVATLPIPGMQLLAAAVLAWMIRGNVAAALLGTFWANPLTLPVIWLSAHWVGCGILGVPAVLTAVDLVSSLAHVRAALVAPGTETLATAYGLLWPALKPIAVGAVPIAIVSSVIFYWFTLNLIAGYRAGRSAIVGDPLPDDGVGSGHNLSSQYR